jgi:hypothetical protein
LKFIISFGTPCSIRVSSSKIYNVSFARELAIIIVQNCVAFQFRFSPYEKGFGYFANNGKTDEKGSRLAKPDPIYETLFSGANGRPARTVGTQVAGPVDEGPDEEEQMTFTLLNSFWFMIASLLQQGTDLLPK